MGLKSGQEELNYVDDVARLLDRAESFKRATDIINLLPKQYLDFI